MLNSSVIKPNAVLYLCGSQYKVSEDERIYRLNSQGEWVTSNNSLDDIEVMYRASKNVNYGSESRGTPYKTYGKGRKGRRV